MKPKKWSILKQVFVLYLFVIAVYHWIGAINEMSARALGNFWDILVQLLNRLLSLDLIFILYVIAIVLLDNMKYKPVKKYVIGYFICLAIYHGYFGFFTMISLSSWHPNWWDLIGFSAYYFIIVVVLIIKDFFTKRRKSETDVTMCNKDNYKNSIEK